MALKIVHLLPDTNLFVQCLPLEDLDWSAWAEFDEVQLIVTRPVQKKIDNQKNRGGDRLGRRARKTSSLFRDIILSKQHHKLVRDAGPCVKLFIKPQYTHNPALADRLNFQERDDQLVGTVHTFMQQHSEADVRLLTHDTGPMAAAQMLDVPVAVIPDEWLLPPESSETQKKISALESELARLKKSEPDFHIRCLDDAGNEIVKLEAEFMRYEPLTNDELSGLMTRIKERFPMAADFGPREPAERKTKIPDLSISGPTETFTPATEEEIIEYRDEKYRAWLEQCEDILRNYHRTLQRQAGPPVFCFVVRNEGTRPGKDALVTIEAKGNFAIMPLAQGNDEDDEDQQEKQIIELPRPPAPPRGKWEPKSPRQFTDAFGSFGSLHRSLSAKIGYDPLRARLHDLHIPRLHDLTPRRDPNAFYWKPKRPMMPQSSFSLECEQWRHGTDDEFFNGDIYFGEDEERVAGALECLIHAANLSDTTIKRIPVRIEVKRVSIIERAEKLVDWLVGPGEEQSTSIPES